MLVSYIRSYKLLVLNLTIYQWSFLFLFYYPAALQRQKNLYPEHMYKKETFLKDLATYIVCYV